MLGPELHGCGELVAIALVLEVPIVRLTRSARPREAGDQHPPAIALVGDHGELTGGLGLLTGQHPARNLATGPDREVEGLGIRGLHAGVGTDDPTEVDGVGREEGGLGRHGDHAHRLLEEILGLRVRPQVLLGGRGEGDTSAAGGDDEVGERHDCLFLWLPTLRAQVPLGLGNESFVRFGRRSLGRTPEICVKKGTPERGATSQQITLREMYILSC